MSELITNPDEKEIVMAYLEAEREVWLPLHTIAVRSGGMNGEANAAEAAAMVRIDRLLDQLGAITLRETMA